MYRNLARLLSYNLFNKKLTTIGTVRHYAALPKRFYRKVDISVVDNRYGIKLDERNLKTPNGNIFSVDNEMLALAVAAEWDSQDQNIQMSLMHLNALCNTVIDNPLKANHDTLVPCLLNFLTTDVVLYHNEEDEELHRIQQNEWTPVIEKFNNLFKTDVSPITTISPTSIDKEAQESLRRHLMSYNLHSLQGLVFAAESLKSFILTMCCIEQEISTEKAVLLSRLEEEFQIGNWGRIEWAHDVNHADLLARVSAAILFARINLESSNFEIK